jgi:Glycosyl hydrolase family 26
VKHVFLLTVIVTIAKARSFLLVTIVVAVGLVVPASNGSAVAPKVALIQILNSREQLESRAVFNSRLLILWRGQSRLFNSPSAWTLTSPIPVTIPTLPTAPTGTNVSEPFQEGAYVGPADPTGVESFAQSTDTDITIASDYLPASNGWSGMDGANGSINWLTNAWQDSGYTLSLGVPMIPTNSAGQLQGTLAQGAAGAYNGYFSTLASTLVAAGEGNAYLRLGWEFDGNWYAWQAQSATAESNYASYFRNIVTAMRSVPGEQFKFVWNPDASAFLSSSYSVTAAYPGNKYVNVIGLDLYDLSWASPLTPEVAWTNTYLPALTAAESFAQSEGVPLALCEWGTLFRSNGLGDDPYYINNMIDWMSLPSHDVAYESYFNGNTTAAGGSATQNLNGGSFPQGQTVFVADLG